jgi:hypothetical protein
MKVVILIVKTVGFLKAGEACMNNYDNVKSLKDTIYSKNLDCFIKEMEGDFFIEKKKMVWDSLVWDRYYNFYKYDFFKSKRKLPLDLGFMLFSKAYIKHLHSYGRRNDYNKRMNVLKILESVLLHEFQSAKIYNCSNFIFERCVEIFTNIYSETTAYNAGKELKEIEKFLREYNLADLGYVEWFNPLKMPIYEVKSYDHNLAGHDKLPDISYIVELAKVFAKDDKSLSKRDMFTASVLTLLMCAPSRISEILSLPADCEVWEQNSNGIERYGIRFFSAKGYEGDVKWIASSMVPVAKKAIARLKLLSQSGRELAQYLETSEIYRNSLSNEINNDYLLSAEQVCSVLGFTNLSPSSINKKLSTLDLIPNDYTYSLKSLNEILKQWAPDDFPWYDRKKNIKYSNALCLLKVCDFKRLSKSSGKLFFKPVKHNISYDIENGGIFSKSKQQSASDSSLKTHSIRHFLNTLAQIAGMSEFDIARWSGRQCIAQNSVYDHTPHAHMVAQVVKAKALEKVGNVIPVKMIFEKKLDENKEITGATLVSKHGLCRLKYAMQPCKYYPVSESGSDIKEIRDLQCKILSIAESDFRDGNMAAEKWKDFHTKTITKGETNG